MKDTKDIILKFLKQIDNNIEYDTQLITDGYIDSLNMVNVIVFLEHTFNIKLNDVKPHNLYSIDKIAELVEITMNPWVETIIQPPLIDGPDYNLILKTDEYNLKDIEPVNYIIPIGDTCAPSNLITWNNARSLSTWNSFVFEWSLSNMSCICDVTKNGIDWHIQNNIKKIMDSDDGIIYNEDRYRFKSLSYPHHRKNYNWMIRSIERYFNILNTESNVIFLHMSTTDLNLYKEKFIEFENILKEQYKVNFKIIAIQSIQKIKNGLIEHTKIDEKLHFFTCDSNFVFDFLVRKNDDIFFKKLFQTIIPCQLDIR